MTADPFLGGGSRQKNSECASGRWQQDVPDLAEDYYLTVSLVAYMRLHLWRRSLTKVATIRKKSRIDSTDNRKEGREGQCHITLSLNSLIGVLLTWGHGNG